MFIGGCISSRDTFLCILGAEQLREGCVCLA